MSQSLMGKITKYAKGDVIIRENEISRKMFVLKTGKVRVFKAYMGQKITLAILGEGEIFGEMSFFDGQPRSATVEALTPLECFVLDSEEASQQFKALPGWFMPIVKTVFSRLRSVDTRATILQTMNEIEKKHFKRDSVARALYTELLRFNKVLNLVYDRAAASGRGVKVGELLQELDEILGERTVSLQAYWKLLKDYDFISRDGEREGEETVTLNRDALGTWTKALAEEVTSERYLLLSHSGVALLKRIVGQLQIDESKPGAATEITVGHDDIDLLGMTLHEEALEELKKIGLISPLTETSFKIDPAKVFKAFTYQSLLKYFDHSVQAA